MKKILTIAALSALTGVYGQIDRSVRPTAAPAPTINIKNSEVFTLSNGITVVVSENHQLPRVSFNLVMGASSRVEGSKAGLNQLMGQLLMSGTTGRTKDALDKEIDYIGATLNADGGSVFFSGLTKHMDLGLSLMQDVVMNPSFPQSEFDRIKKQNESNLLSTKSSPEEMGANAERKINFPNHPNSNVMNEATLAAITLDDIKKEYNAVYTPSGAYLVIVGDITPAAAKAAAEKYFATWKGQSLIVQDLGAGEKPKGNRVIFVNKPGSVQSVISVSFPVKMQPGDQNQIPLTVLNGIFGGGGFGTRLMQNLREDKAYTYGCYSDLQITREGSWMSASGSFRNEVTDSAITQLLYEFERITEGYVKDEELALTKSSMAGGFARSLESPQTIARFALNIIRNKLPADYYQNYLRRLDAVTKEDILRMAQEYFTGGYNIVVVGNESVLEKIKQFDTDGKIEKLDAFGDPAIDMLPADISADDLISKYVSAVTKTSSPKALSKKMKSIKSVQQETELSSSMFPGALTARNIFVAPNKEAESVSMGAMTFQSSYFTGTAGAETVQGVKKELTAEEMASKAKSLGLFPELNYAKQGMKYELKGIEVINGKQYYVLETNDGKRQQFDYFDKSSFMKFKTVTVTTVEGETVEVSREYSDYKEVNGLLFAHTITQTVGEMSFSGTVKSVVINGKVDPKVFE